MAGKIVGAVITLFFISFMTIISISYFQHQNLREVVNDINYYTADTVSTSGILTTSVFTNLQESIDKFGSFRIILKLEKQIKIGVYDTFFDNTDILDHHFQVGDRLTIYLEDRSRTLFGRLISASILLFNPDRQADFTIQSVKTAVISKDTRNLVKGYDIIAEIGKIPTNITLAVFVATKLNPTGKYYGTSGHIDVPISNPVYGDTTDEQGNTGINYIFDNGDFLQETLYYTGGGIRLLRFIQQ
jgi:hypothetical protein